MENKRSVRRLTDSLTHCTKTSKQQENRSYSKTKTDNTLLASICNMSSETSENDGKNYNVIIVGAGVSGLSAGRYLQHTFTKSSKKPLNKTFQSRPPSVLILEARDRIGGRVSTHVDESHPGVFIDLGATWVHGSKKDGQPIALLADSINCKLVSDDLMDEIVYELDNGGRQIPSKEKEIAMKKCINTLKKAKAYAKKVENKKRLSIKEALENVEPNFCNDFLMQFYVRNMIEFDVGGPTDAVSAALLDEDSEFEGGDFLPKTGYKPIIDELAKGLQIQCSVQVRKIIYDTEKVRLETNQGVYTADKVICTIPLGVMKAGAITFQPHLSESKLTAIDRIGFGVVNKIGLLFDEVLWPKHPFGFGIVADRPTYSYILNKFAVNRVPLLEAYLVGNHAVEMEGKEDEELVDDLLSVLGTIFQLKKEELSRHLVKRYIQRWGQEEFTRGSYSYASSETRQKDFEAFESSQLKVLYFAGEHTISEFRGTVHGAFLSGRRAAKQVLKSMR
mmetsp:Transcript_26350/g.46471  ORF Transcript_26350/g.46471 Transcript_26350/m.46471 type:complete len:505 (+) Transcript_26350:89-1603(+)